MNGITFNKLTYKSIVSSYLPKYTHNTYTFTDPGMNDQFSDVLNRKSFLDMHNTVFSIIRVRQLYKA